MCDRINTAAERLRRALEGKPDATRVNLTRQTVMALLNALDAKDAEIEEWRDRALDEADESMRLREALTPSGDTKYAYSGEFSWTEWLPDEDGIEQGYERVIPWATIKEIMVEIRARAALSGEDET